MTLYFTNRWYAHLGQNLATAAQLERSFWMGAQYGRSKMGPARLTGELTKQFRPGCGKSAT